MTIVNQEILLETIAKLQEVTNCVISVNNYSELPFAGEKIPVPAGKLKAAKERINRGLSELKELIAELEDII